jgi:hypothetical protein
VGTMSELLTYVTVALACVVCVIVLASAFSE